METLDDDENPRNGNDRMMSRTESSNLITDMIQEILLRLPVRSLLRFSSVSKPWLSRISDPSFVKFHHNITVNHRISHGGAALFIYAVDKSTCDHYLLSASHNGGALTHLVTLPTLDPDPSTGPGNYFESNANAQYVNGLVLFTSRFYDLESTILFNPSTRKSLELRPANVVNEHFVYMLGFDESCNEYKILNIRVQFGDTPVGTGWMTEFEIFTLSTRSWKKVNLELPTEISIQDLHIRDMDCVCVDGLMYSIFGLMRGLVLVFDLMKEALSIMKLPLEAVPSTPDAENGYNDPCLMKMNGLLAVVCHDRVVETNEMDIWILEDYRNQVWVKETITFSSPWIVDSPFPLGTMLHTGEIIFMPRRLSRDVLCLLVYDMKKKIFRSVEFAVDPEMFGSREVEFRLVGSYVESMIPL